MQVIGMKTKLEEKIKALENEKNMLLEEIEQLREVVELSEKAKVLENEVDKLKKEAKTLKERIPSELLRELGETASQFLEEEEEECSSCNEEELL
ncbi:MAG: hypothetical protein QHH18_02525 [Candidatus Bathyarchaeota archaeon]|nr:hypothetical protein [Candidatus Bathyarchaeota archaeon A05DMB-5]MDH7557470.1 hypothetical protein [Candidatus Bathyarchaeota archaeon]